MSVDLKNTLVIGISSRSLFDLEGENRIFEEQGLDAYRAYQIDHEDVPPKQGTAFHLVEAILKLNQYREQGRPPLVEVIILSRNDAGMGLRIFNGIKSYGLDEHITRAAFVSGASLAPYLDAYSVDLFLSKSEQDVQEAVNAGVAAAVIQEPPEGYEPDRDVIRLAFDGDAVLFSDEAERVFQEVKARDGHEAAVQAFVDHERENAQKELPEGPFGKLLKTLAKMNGRFPPEERPVRIALVTARNAPAHERVIRTLRAWNVDVDEAFFLGGLPKAPVLQAFRTHLFFDDQPAHVDPASRTVPAGQVPYLKLTSSEQD
ncbi:5'-nucleotidase [Thiohalobacter thiocyanaticus]|uniref:5'-nucleotidase n=1 Tax=Thiohalobacter thiocyanaticus TaxID=585455 RepID=A0A1Z4VQ36_9GAMM|nr:5'-nucleotidase [Thiohalobacter thiocyanaticus]BAZ93749.1 5'-nucleotidase [Thiohalobacter thiocyanaticus]